MNHMTVMPDDAHTTVREIAQRAGVSPGTVSRALKGFDGVSLETRRTILDIAKESGYNSSRIRRKRIGRVAFLIRRIKDDGRAELYYSRLLRSVEAACHTNGVLISSIVVDRTDNVLEKVHANACDAAICAGFFDAETLRLLNDSGKPLVLIDMKLRGCSSVNPDNETGAYEATRHLIATGRTKIGMITGPVGHLNVRERIRGYRKALFDAAILANPRYEVDIPEGTDFDEGAREAMQTLLERRPRPNAVFCHDDATALIAMRTCLSAGLKVPHDISIVGFDDLPEAMLGHRPLSTVHVEVEELGARSVELLLREEPSIPIEKIVPVQLVVRTSTVVKR